MNTIIRIRRVSLVGLVALLTLARMSSPAKPDHGNPGTKKGPIITSKSTLYPIYRDSRSWTTRTWSTRGAFPLARRAPSGLVTTVQARQPFMLSPMMRLASCRWQSRGSLSTFPAKVIRLVNCLTGPAPSTATSLSS